MKHNARTSGARRAPYASFIQQASFSRSFDYFFTVLGSQYPSPDNWSSSYDIVEEKNESLAAKHELGDGRKKRKTEKHVTDPRAIGSRSRDGRITLFLRCFEGNDDRMKVRREKERLAMIFLFSNLPSAFGTYLWSDPMDLNSSEAKSPSFETSLPVEL